MKKTLKFGILAIVFVMSIISCTEEDTVDIPSAMGIAIIGSSSTSTTAGQEITVSLSLLADEGISSLTVNGSSLEVTSGATVEYIDYDYTVDESTTSGSEISLEFILTDLAGAMDVAIFEISTLEDAANFIQVGAVTIGGEGAAEITAFDVETAQLFVVNNDGGATIDVIDFENPSSPSVTSSIDVSSFGGGANSVAVSQGRLAIAVEANDKQAAGTVLVYNTSSLTNPSTYTVGSLPDMVTFTPDGTALLVANEGEPNDDYTVDPEGSVSIITFADLTDVTSGSVAHATFSGFNDDEEDLEAAGFRVSGPNATLAQDVEPEYITVSVDSDTAYVALQENNGLAVIDIASGTVAKIVPLGFKDYRENGLRIDPSDEDGTVSFGTVDFPLFGVYQPDAIASFSINGSEYIISANEGDGREYEGAPGFIDEERIADLTLDDTVFPDAALIQNDLNFGKLLVMTDLGDSDTDGDYDELYTYGGRSFSIWGTDGELLWDSGNELDDAAAAAGVYDDSRSDAKSTEPEGVVVGVVDESTYAFVGLERVDAVAVYDISNPTSPFFMQMIQTGDAPEGLVFIPAEESPNGKSTLVVSCEDDGTVYVYQPF